MGNSFGQVSQVSLRSCYQMILITEDLAMHGRDTSRKINDLLDQLSGGNLVVIAVVFYGVSIGNMVMVIVMVMIVIVMMKIVMAMVFNVQQQASRGG